MSGTQKTIPGNPEPPAPAPHEPPKRSARHVLLFTIPKKKTWWWLAGVVGALALGFTLMLWLTDFDWSSVRRGLENLNAYVEHLNPVAVLPLMAILPVFGFPIGLVYLVAGARYGLLGGGVVVAIMTTFHLLGSYYVGRSFLRGPIERFLARKNRHLPQVPEDEQVLVCVIAALVPGLPYAMRNYLLVLAGVRLKTLFWVCLPIYIARSYASILLGDFGGDPSRRALIILLLVDGLKLGVCAFVIWKLRQHHKKFHPAPPVPAPDAAR